MYLHRPEWLEEERVLGELRVLAIDPGGTTGYAFMRCLPAKRTSIAASELRVGADQVTEFAVTVRRQVQEHRLDCVVIEDFIMRPQHHGDEDKHTIRIIAMVEYAINGLCPLYKQTSDVLRVITDERLKKWGYWVKSRKGDARSATKHALMWERKFVKG